MLEKQREDHSKKADLSKEEEMIAYEEFATAEDIIEQLLDMAEVDSDQPFALMNEEEVMIAPDLAEHIVYVVDQLDESNKETFIELLLKDEESFAKMVLSSH